MSFALFHLSDAKHILSLLLTKFNVWTCATKVDCLIVLQCSNALKFMLLSLISLSPLNKQMSSISLFLHCKGFLFNNYVGLLNSKTNRNFSNYLGQIPSWIWISEIWVMITSKSKSTDYHRMLQLRLKPTGLSLTLIKPSSHHLKYPLFPLFQNRN